MVIDSDNSFSHGEPQPPAHRCARGAVTAAIEQYAKPLGDLVARDANEGVEWLILTNGQAWQVWHLMAGLPVVMDKVLDVELLAAGPVTAKVDQLFHLSRPAMRRQTIAALWQSQKATSPASITRALLSPTVLDEIRKEVRRQTEHNPSVAEVEAALRGGVIRADCL